ncbi:MAG: hypothetical protein WAW96_17020 [Alphaproteobacteria bacterium]
MNLNLTIVPLIPVPLLAVLGVLCVGVIGLGFFFRARGAALRALALGLALLALAGPSLNRETRKPVNDVIAVVVDHSQSEHLPGRTEAADKALATLKEQLNVKGIDLRIVDAASNPDDDGTHLFGPLADALRDVPSDRLGGAILLTDGEIHDVPPNPKAAGIDAPVHTLITGKKGEADRKLTIVEAPRFGIVGQTLAFQVRVDDLGNLPANEPARASARIEVRIDGGEPNYYTVPVGGPRTIEFQLAHGGENVVEVEAEPGPAELTLQNNRAVIVTNGVRDRLRVLLISGEPHAGERTWRNLLKADPSVDLVHFTILRPPEKQDDTDDRELALIGFPVRELFSVKLYDFDLIIFDRYRRREVIPSAYFGYMADYVESGGALLIAAGPDYNSVDSIANTALVSLLPAQPTSHIFEQGFQPRVSPLGFRHPVTAGLSGANPPDSDAAPTWGRWFRLVDTQQVSGETLMTGPDQRPLLILDTAGKGRVAQLLSDQAWLWARGFEGGGPQAELLRRLAHWLMKEPDLEEEVLHGEVKGHAIEITRRTMADTVAPVEVTTPSGKKQNVTLAQTAPGRFEAAMPIDEVGLYHMTDGKLNALVAVGPLNPREVSDMRATDELVAPVAKATGGGTYWIGTGNSPDLPGIRFVARDRTAAGRDWLGIRRNGAYVVTSIEETPLVVPSLALAIIAGLFLLAWRRESQ